MQIPIAFCLLPFLFMPSKSPASEPVHITIRLFNYSPASKRVTREAIAEANRIFQTRDLPVVWLDCTPPIQHADCILPDHWSRATVRLIPTALLGVNSETFGITGRSGTGCVGIVFYDRAAAFAAQRMGVWLPLILGRVMAHEATHMLLPARGHFQSGLMKPHLAEQDFRVGCLECASFVDEVAERLRREVVRRVSFSGTKVELAKKEE